MCIVDKLHHWHYQHHLNHYKYMLDSWKSLVIYTTRFQQSFARATIQWADMLMIFIMGVYTQFAQLLRHQEKKIGVEETTID